MNQISEAFQAAYPYVLWNGHGVKTKSIISNITIKESEKTRLLLTKKYKPTKNISNKQICRREKEHYKYSIKMWMWISNYSHLVITTSCYACTHRDHILLSMTLTY